MLGPEHVELGLLIIQPGHKCLQLCYHGNMLLCCCHGGGNNVFSFQVAAKERGMTMGEGLEWAGHLTDTQRSHECQYRHMHLRMRTEWTDGGEWCVMWLGLKTQRRKVKG